MNADRLFPGMCDDSQEYFYHEEMQEVMLIHKGSTRKFSDLQSTETSALDAIIDSDHKLRKILSKWFPNNRDAQKMELAKCRFGGLNMFPDISPDGIQNDHRECRLYGLCEGENIVCKPLQYNENEISNQEIHLIRHLCSDEKNYEIAAEMKLHLGTFNVLKSSLYEKLNIHNKQDLTRVAVKLGIC